MSERQDTQSKKIQDYWDQVASDDPNYASCGAASLLKEFYGDVYRLELSYSLKFLDFGKIRRVLEVGCGWGRLISRISGRAEAVGIDISRAMLKRALSLTHNRARAPHFIQAEAGSMPFRSKCFESVYSYLVLQHIGRDGVIKAVSEMARILGDKGIALATLPNRLGPDGILSKIMIDLLGLPSYWGPAKVTHYNKNEILAVFFTGFRNLELRPWEFRLPWIIVRGKPLKMRVLMRLLRILSRNLETVANSGIRFLGNFATVTEVVCRSPIREKTGW